MVILVKNLKTILNAAFYIFKLRYNDKNCHIWYDHMEPVHPYINKDITDVFFNTVDFKFSSKLAVSKNNV